MEGAMPMPSSGEAKLLPVPTLPTVYIQPQATASESESFRLLQSASAVVLRSLHRHTVCFASVTAAANLNLINMFGGFGGALKNLSSQVEDVVEKTKKDVEALAIEKKGEAQTLLEGQLKKTSDALMSTKSDVERSAVGAACDAKKAAIDGFDKECAGAEKAKDDALKEVSSAQVEATAAADSAKAAVGGAQDAVAGALSGVEGQIQGAVSGAVKQVEEVVDAKLKEADHFLDEKRDEVVKQVKDATTKASGQAEEGIGSVLGKAKGLLNF